MQGSILHSSQSGEIMIDVIRNPQLRLLKKRRTIEMGKMHPYAIERGGLLRIEDNSYRLSPSPGLGALLNFIPESVVLVV